MTIKVRMADDTMPPIIGVALPIGIRHPGHSQRWSAFRVGHWLGINNGLFEGSHEPVVWCRKPRSTLVICDWQNAVTSLQRRRRICRQIKQLFERRFAPLLNSAAQRFCTKPFPKLCCFRRRPITLIREGGDFVALKPSPHLSRRCKNRVGAGNSSHCRPS